MIEAARPKYQHMTIKYDNFCSIENWLTYLDDIVPNEWNISWLILKARLYVGADWDDVAFAYQVHHSV